MSKPFRARLALSLMWIPLLVTSCTANTPRAGITAATASPIATLPPAATDSPTAIPTAEPTTPAAPTVAVTALKGNLFIRRGPDLAYNPVSVLTNGQSARALARDVLAEWLQIAIPGRSGQTGWVSIQTRFTAVQGDIMKLPEILPTEWPVGASLRNCTHHQMEADPGGITIPPIDSFPENEVQINPGIYTIHDTVVDGSPEVMKVEIREGSEVDIRTDGNGNRRKCPAP